jgi:hypothetical protein
MAGRDFPCCANGFSTPCKVFLPSPREPRASQCHRPCVLKQGSLLTRLCIFPSWVFIQEA